MEWLIFSIPACFVIPFKDQKLFACTLPSNSSETLFLEPASKVWVQIFLLGSKHIIGPCRMCVDGDVGPNCLSSYHMPSLSSKICGMELKMQLNYKNTKIAKTFTVLSTLHSSIIALWSHSVNFLVLYFFPFSIWSFMFVLLKPGPCSLFY